MLARKTLLIMANNAVGGFLGFVILYLIANFMIEADYNYGVVAFGLAFLGMFMFIISPGTNTAHIKRISEGKDVGVCIGTFLAMKVVLTTLFLAVVLTCIFGWNNFLGQGFESPQHRIVIFILLFNFVITSFNGVIISTFEAKKEIAKVQIGMLLSTLARMATVMIVVSFGLGIYGLAITWNISILTYFIASVIMFRGYPIKRPSWALAKDYMKFSLPLLFATLAVQLAFTTDRVMIQLFWGSADVGHYFAAWRITAFITLFSVGVQKLVFPTISEYHSENKMGHIKELTWTAEKYIALFIIPICFFIAFFPRDVIGTMLSDKFLPAAPILAIFTIYSLLAALNIPYASQLPGTNRPGLAAALGIPRCLLNILLNILLIPTSIWGIRLAGLKGTGAAIATAISMALYFVATRIVVYKYISKTKNNFKILFNLLSAAIMGLFLKFILYDYYPITHVWDYLIYAALGGTIYFSFMALFGQFKKKDIAYIIQVIDPIKMTKYILHELLGRKKDKQEPDEKEKAKK